MASATAHRPDRSRRRGPSTDGDGETPDRRCIRPVLWWAGTGAFFLALQAYVYLAWITSDNFRPTPLGPDPVPSDEKVWAWFLQTACTLGAVIVAVWIVRGCLRQRRLTLDAKLTLAWYSIVWLDPAGNFLRPQFMFNAYYVNRGSWVSNIPGWVSPNGHLFPDALLVEIPIYGSLVLVAVASCALMRHMSHRRPRLGLFGLTAGTLAATAAFIIAFESIFCMRSGFASWSATSVPGLTLWSGTRWQVPLMPDPLFWGAVMTSLAVLRYRSDDHGRTDVDRGIERVTTAPRMRTVLSTLAVIGFANLAMAIHTVPSVVGTLYLKETVPGLPSYLRSGLCGDDTPYKCPGRDVPIRLPHNQPTATVQR